MRVKSKKPKQSQAGPAVKEADRVGAKDIVEIRIKGLAPLTATIHELEKLRCNLRELRSEYPSVKRFLRSRTCELSAVNPHDYLMALLNHSLLVQTTPSKWMHWSYQDSVRAYQASSSL